MISKLRKVKVQIETENFSVSETSKLPKIIHQSCEFIQNNMDFFTAEKVAVNHPSFSSSPQDQPSPTSQVAGDDKAEILQHSIGSRPLTEQLR